MVPDDRMIFRDIEYEVKPRSKTPRKGISDNQFLKLYQNRTRMFGVDHSIIEVMSFTQGIQEKIRPYRRGYAENVYKKAKLDMILQKRYNR